MFKFGERSIKNLNGVHPDLVLLMEQSIVASPYDFGITEGVRSVERQRQLYAEGKSMTLLSRHITGHAVDIMVYANGKGTWDGKYYDIVAKHITAKALELGVPIVWGGTFRSLVDKVHWELDKNFYR